MNLSLVNKIEVELSMEWLVQEELSFATPYMDLGSESELDLDQLLQWMLLNHSWQSMTADKYVLMERGE